MGGERSFRPAKFQMSRQAAAVFTQLPIDDRLTLPKHFCDRLSWLLQGTEKNVEAWIYVVEPGRFRILSDADVENDPQLEPLRAFVLQGHSLVPQGPSRTRSAGEAASVMRLIPVAVENHRGSWRMLLPEQVAALRPRNCDPRTLAFFMPDGYLEIWYADFLHLILQPQWPR